MARGTPCFSAKLWAAEMIFSALWLMRKDTIWFRVLSGRALIVPLITAGGQGRDAAEHLRHGAVHGRQFVLQQRQRLLCHCGVIDLAYLKCELHLRTFFPHENALFFCKVLQKHLASIIDERKVFLVRRLQTFA